jgi:sugar lactone lactonase YvrE
MQRRIGRLAIGSLLSLILWLVPAAADAAPILWKTFGNFARPSGIAVDESSGNVFVADGAWENTVDIYGPEGEAPAGVASAQIFGFFFGNEPSGVAVDNSGGPADGTVYVADVINSAVKKFVLNPATEAYEEVGTLSATPGFSEPLGVTVAPDGDVYVADYGSQSVIVFDSTGTEINRIDVSTPVNRPSSVAVDSAGNVFVQAYVTGNVFKYAANGSGEVEAGTTPVEVVSSGATGVAVDSTTNTLYVAMGGQIVQFDAATLAELDSFGAGELEFTERIAVDASTGRIYVADAGKNKVVLFVPPPPPVAPSVLSESAVPTYTETELRASIDPGNDEVTYHFEYGPTPAYGSSTPTKTLPRGFEPIDVSAFAFGLAQGASYHYRIVVSNSAGTIVGPDQTFVTQVRPATPLPDNRAYELVTPSDTGGTFIGMFSAGDSFDTWLATPDGNSIIFGTQSALPGLGGNGRQDGYESVRTASGWATHRISPTGDQAVAPKWGGTSKDHQYTLWASGFNGGSLQLNEEESHYVRQPNGSFELIGRGSIGEDPEAIGRWISPGAEHLIFTSDVQLAPTAPGGGILTIYDRPALGEPQVVSLLPGDTPANADAQYLGTSEDGSAVAFTVEGTLYVRLDNQETVEVASGGPTFAGLSADGSRAFYLSSGDIFAFDTGSKATASIGSGGESTVVNISADGSHVYFASPQLLDGAAGEAGEPNLYVWDGNTIQFVATLADQDFESFKGSSLVHLGRWVNGVGPDQSELVGRANDPSRTTPDGTVLVFQSHGVAGDLYDSNGHFQVYRYSSESGAVICLSCNRNEVPNADAELQATFNTVVGAPTIATSRIPNVTDDGNTVFFETADALVPEDTDGRTDVYEWKNGGGTWLISSGRSAGDDHLFAMSTDGRDVFFKTGDALLPEDTAIGSESIYDARVNGGFPQPLPSGASCQEGSCQGSGSAAPAAPIAGSSLLHGPANARHRQHRKKKRCHRHGSKRKHCHRHGKGKHRHKGNRVRTGNNRGGVK